MSRKQFKSQASSSRAVSGQTSGGFGGFGGVQSSSPNSSFGGAASVLSYLSEQPDLTAISDANVIVNFKNLAKRDSTTKSRALEDLQNYVSAQKEGSNEVEEGIIDAWIRVYPRTSIDGSRRVRQLAHTLTGELAAASGKRIARHIPKVIGSWLAGLHDGDTSVTRSAQEALKLVFSTPEKQSALSRVYQQPILEYCKAAILNETAETLSDPRNTSAEDSEAKYARVVASHVLVVRNLLENLPDTEVDKHGDLYDDLLKDSRMWEFISSNDAGVRRAVMKLLQTCIKKRQDLISANQAVIATALLSKKTLGHQLGSAYDFSECLLATTAHFPGIWTENVGEKASPLARLQRLLKSGSQGGPPAYWANTAKIVAQMPDEVFPKELQEAVKTTKNMQNGISRREEPRANSAAAWQTYFALAQRLSAFLSPDDQQQLLRETCLPVIQEYIIPTQQNSSWSITNVKAPDVLSEALADVKFQAVAEQDWPRLADSILEGVQTSSPAQAKDFDSNQNTVAAQSKRWFALQADLLKVDLAPSFKDVIAQTSEKILKGSIDVVVARQGKPYGAAETIHVCLRSTGSLILQNPPVKDIVDAFLCFDLPDLILSPSGPKLTSILYDSIDSAKFADAWVSALHNILSSSDDSNDAILPLRTLLGNSLLLDRVSIAKGDIRLQQYYVDETKHTLMNGQSWAFLEKPIRADLFLERSSIDQMLSDITKSLSLEGETSNALSGLETIMSNNSRVLTDYVTSDIGTKIIQNLLLLADSDDENNSRMASQLAQSIQALMFESRDGGKSSDAILGIIKAGLAEASVSSLPTETLADLAIKYLGRQGKPSSDDLLQILPDRKLWNASLRASCDSTPSETLAITGQMGGAIYLCKASSEDATESSALGRDINGFTSIVRMVRYTVQLLGGPSNVELLSASDLAQYYQLMFLTIQLINDKLTAGPTNNLWTSTNSGIEQDMLELVSTAQALFRSWNDMEEASAKQSSGSAFTFLAAAQSEFYSHITDFSTFSFYNAQSYCVSVSDKIETYGWRQGAEESPESRLRELRKNNTSFALLAVLGAFKKPLTSTPTLTRFCNELVADLTAQKAEESHQQVVFKLACLNIILQDQEEIAETIAKQRLIFFVKHVIPWLLQAESSAAVKSETCRALTSLLPYMSDIFGTHWTEIIQFLAQLWSAKNNLDQTTVWTARLPLIHSSLKLCEILRGLTFDEDCNEDLKDAWQESFDGLARGLINVLQQSGEIQEEANQGLRIVNQLLARQISRMPSTSTDDFGDLFPLLSVESAPVQATAFSILHKRIPNKQEQISLDTALEKSTARLPEELLSLVLQSPSLELMSRTSLERAIPCSVRGYLSSWLLVFDHFKKASDKVKSDYIAHLKEDDYLDQLLGFTFQFLGHSTGKPVDVSKLELTTYSFDIQESPIKDLQWLLTHLYYLCLKRMPSATKTWWFECKSRQTVINVESWTEKYISPVVITDALNTVEQWAASQDSSADDDLVTKVNHRTKEIMVSKEIDDQQLSMVIRLPANFPLGQAVVEGVNRVAVDEKKWRSWLLNAQGVITFSNNSLTDGIIAFRRNVVGALKGQTECAICYSIISADKQLPTKRCGTCKNLFHGSCLFKWFKTSNSSSCPLCRNPFNYT